MGKNKKDPAKVAAKKAKAAAKQEKSAIKANKKDIKALGINEDDIETIIAEYQEKDRARTAVTITSCPQPSPRSNFSLTALSNNEFLLFGGEYCDGEGTTVYNEVYRWNLDKNEWKLIESLNTPPPRCSHQAVYFKDKVYVFGGEYATLDQFYHYKDMWALDLKTNVWEELPVSKDGPSARSGHRMVVWRNCIILFGGFYEALREVRWYSDLYVFSLTERKWMQVPPKPYVQAPRARSGFLMTTHPSEDAIFVFGGYSKEKVASTGGGTGGGKKSEGKIHTDMWMLSLKGVIGGKSSSGSTRLDVGKISWQKLSNKGTPPSVRCGASMVSYKNKGIYFGGVNDSEGPRHTIVSTFYNDLYAFDFERKRWYQLGLKTPKTDKKSRGKKKKEAKKQSELEEEDEECESSDEEESSDDDDNDEESLRLRQLERDNENCFGYIDDDGNIVYVKLDDDPLDEQKEEELSDIILKDQSSIVTNQDGGGDWVTVSEVDVAIIEDNLRGKADCQDFKVEETNEDMVESTAVVESMDDKEVSTPVSKFDDMTGVECSKLQQYFMENNSVPVPRINSSLVMRGCSLFVYGGLTEIGDVEVTLDDCWSLDLNKRDQWKQILPGTMSEMIWKGEDDLESAMTGETGSDFGDSDDEEDEYGYDEEEECGEEGKKSKRKHKEADKDSKGKKASKGKRISSEATGVRAELQMLKAQLPAGGEDDRQYPLSVNNDRGDAVYRAETLKEYYSRTSDFWKQTAIDVWQEQKLMSGVSSLTTTGESDSSETHIDIENVTSDSSNSALDTLRNLASVMRGGQESLSDKEIKKVAFSLCQEQYDAVLVIAEQLVALESALSDEHESMRGDRRKKKSSEKSGKKK